MKNDINDFNEMIKEIVPNVKTIEETYPDDTSLVQIICRECDCDKSEFLLTKDEADLVQEQVPLFKELRMTMNREEREIRE